MPSVHTSLQEDEASAGFWTRVLYLEGHVRVLLEAESSLPGA